MDRRAWIVDWAVDAKAYLDSIPKRRQVIILKKIDEELTFAPFDTHAKKKQLKKIPPELARYGVPIWQLTVYPYRVRYGLDPNSGAMMILIVELLFKPKEGKEEEGKS